MTEKDMRKIGLMSLALAAALLPSTLFAGRLNGFFPTQQKDQAAETNDACIEVDDESFSAFGVVTGASNGCTVEITYDTPRPNKASSTALTGTQTQGSAKVSQSVFAKFEVEISDTDGVGGVACAAADPGSPYDGSVEENVEKCKVSASMKGTSVPSDPDTVQSSNVSVSCELGTAGVNLVPAPTQTQIDTVVAAFVARKDVTIKNDGKVSITHQGVPNTGSDPCD
jgi:hypothetical protein